jgi:hypothetical protein
MPTKRAPPSVVRTIDVHTGCGHGAVPSSQKYRAEMAVKSAARKPLGTGPPAGGLGPWAAGYVVFEIEDGRDRVVTAVLVTVAVELALGGVW